MLYGMMYGITWYDIMAYMYSTPLRPSPAIAAAKSTEAVAAEAALHATQTASAAGAAGPGSVTVLRQVGVREGRSRRAGPGWFCAACGHCTEASRDGAAGTRLRVGLPCRILRLARPVLSRLGALAPFLLLCTCVLRGTECVAAAELARRGAVGGWQLASPLCARAPASRGRAGRWQVYI
jgi:hypothetical protein